MSKSQSSPIPAWKQLVYDIKSASLHCSWKELATKLAQAREEWRLAQAHGSDHELKPSMLRRCYSHDYSANGSYMITIVARNREEQPFGKVKGSPSIKGATYTLLPDGSMYKGLGSTLSIADQGSSQGAFSFPEKFSVPHMEASQEGQAVLEALSGIPANYPMVEVRQALLMPDHLHLILVVHAPIVSKNGKPQHLGQIIAGYKKGCNRAVWALTSEEEPRHTKGMSNLAVAATTTKQGVSSFSEERKSVWSKGYTDTIITGIRTLDTESAYLDDNPRRLRIKQIHRDLFRTINHIRVQDPQAPGGYRDYAALGNIFLLRKGWHEQVQFHHWEAEVPAGYLPCTRDWNCQQFYMKNNDGSLAYYTIGAPKGKTQAEFHTEQILKNADAGAVHISPFISETEKAIKDALLTMGCAYIRLTKEGFTDLYTPGKSEFYACAEGLLLILAPWEERKRKEPIKRSECIELNRQAHFLSIAATSFLLVRADGAEQVLGVAEE